MRLEDYIYKVARLKQELGVYMPITPEEAVEVYMLEGIIPECVSWRHDEYTGTIWLDGMPKLYNVPNDFTLGELWHNVCVLYRMNKLWLNWE